MDSKCCSRPIGFSSGTLHQAGHPRLAPETLKFFKSLGCTAIELYCEPHTAMEKIIGTSDIWRSFSYVSVHLPTNIPYEDSPDMRALFECAKKLVHSAPIASFVIHPNDVKDLDFVTSYNLPLAFENMDWRKPTGKTVDSLRPFLEHTPHGFIFDINHVFSNDKTMRLGHDLLAAYHSKLKHIHLSGFIDFHEPLVRTHQKHIIDMVPNDTTPIIIESCCTSPEEARQEYIYIKTALEKSQ